MLGALPTPLWFLAQWGVNSDMSGLRIAAVPQRATTIGIVLNPANFRRILGQDAILFGTRLAGRWVGARMDKAEGEEVRGVRADGR